MKSLVGYTGFVESNLYLYNNFNGLYLSMFKVKRRVKNGDQIITACKH